MTTPIISVILPVYNCENYISKAIYSILKQTFSDFEFIIVDDASTDQTYNVLSAYKNKDSRIRIIKNDRNLKIAHSLNKGLHISRSNLIARMDADDWSYPERLERQYLYMKAHPDITVCGTNVEEYETGKKWQVVTDSDQISAELLFKSCLYHPTVMFNKYSILNITGGYHDDMPPIEDYDLWAKLSENPAIKFSNINKVLLRYRIHPDKRKFPCTSDYNYTSDTVRLRLLKRLKIYPEVNEINLHHCLACLYMPSNPSQLRECSQWAKKLLHANTIERVYPQEAFTIVVKRHWLDLCRWSATKIWESAFIYNQKELISHNISKFIWPFRLFLTTVKQKTFAHRTINNF